MSGFTKRSLYHGWTAQNPVVHHEFLRVHIPVALPRNRPNAGHKQAVEDFLKAIEPEEKVIRKMFQEAIHQSAEYSKFSDPKYRVEDFDHFLNLLDDIVETPPKFYKAKAADGSTIGEPIGVPLYLIFDLLSNTSAGYTLLRRRDFNAALKILLNGWGKYLETSDSNKTLTKDEWFSEQGLTVLESGLGKLSFHDTYVVDREEYPQYNSWDSFFIRGFKNVKSVRPIPPQPASGRFFIYNPCESTVFRTATNVQYRDTFWLKSQEYSLFDMLGGDEHEELSKYAELLKGGSVLQSFLAPQDYHRWHSPIKGDVVASKVIDGTYYAVLPDDGAPEADLDLLPGDPHGALIRSQPWLSVVATRAVFIIKPPQDSPLELAAFIAIGMVEVSSCEITTKSGPVEVGTELGTFHFGGSTYSLVVKPKKGNTIVFQDVNDSPARPGQHRWIHSVVAQVWPDSIL